MKDLENSRLDRKNVLNNKYAVEILEKDLDLKDIYIIVKYVF